MTTVTEPPGRDAIDAPRPSRVPTRRIPWRPVRAPGGAKPAHKPLSPQRVIATAALLIACGIAVWSVFFALVLSNLQEAHAQHDAYSTFREELAKQTAPLGGVIDPGSPVALLDAPSLGLNNVVVVEGTASDDLTHGPGHKRNSVLPGQVGTSVVYGRATLFGGPFGDITDAKPGDFIVATTGQGVFRYAVLDVRHVGDPYPEPLAEGGGALTLATSEGASIGNLWQPQRPVYVDTRLVGKAQPSPGVATSAVTDSENAMGGDVGSLYQLVLWLPLLVIAIAATVWAGVRWGRWQSWLIGAPLVVGALWGATETALLLLPNLA